MATDLSLGGNVQYFFFAFQVKLSVLVHKTRQAVGRSVVGGIEHVDIIVLDKVWICSNAQQSFFCIDALHTRFGLEIKFGNLRYLLGGVAIEQYLAFSLCDEDIKIRQDGHLGWLIKYTTGQYILGETVFIRD